MILYWQVNYLCPNRNHLRRLNSGDKKYLLKKKKDTVNSVLFPISIRELITGVLFQLSHTVYFAQINLNTGYWKILEFGSGRL